MNRLGRSIMATAAIAALAVSTAAFAEEPKPEFDQKLENATAVYQELLSTPDRGVPEALLSKCRCVTVIPHAVKGAMIYGARMGTGVMSCRNEKGAWSPPSFIRLAGGSFGPQIGAETSDLVLFFMTERGARSLMTSSKITLGGQAGVAAGPIGRSVEAGTDLKLDAEIYTYAKSKGLFAGAALTGARLSADKKANQKFYGSGVTLNQLIFDHNAPRVPDSARQFMNALTAAAQAQN